MVQVGVNQDYSSLISYFGPANPNETTMRKGKGKKRLKSRKSSKQHSNSVSQNHIEYGYNDYSINHEAVTPLRKNEVSQEGVFVNDVDGKTMSFSEIQIEDQPDVSQYRFLNSMASPGKTELTLQTRKSKIEETDYNKQAI